VEVVGSRKAVLADKHRAALVARLSSLDQRRLLYLHEAAAAGSIRAAADRLNTSASVLSRHIAKMESDLGTALMERHGRGVRLTEAGSLVVEHYLEARERLEALVSQLEDIGGMRRGTVAVAAGEGFVDELMGCGLRTFAERHADIVVDVQTGGTDELVRLVLDDVVHVGLLYNMPTEPRLQSHASARHPMCVVTNPGHPLASLGRRLTIRDLEGHDLGLMPGKFGVRQALLSAEHGGNVRLRPKLTADSSSVLTRFARDWGGVILSPSFAVSRDLRERYLVALETEDTFLEAAEAHLVTRRGRRLPVAAAPLVRHLASALPLLAR